MEGGLVEEVVLVVEEQVRDEYLVTFLLTLIISNFLNNPYIMTY